MRIAIVVHRAASIEPTWTTAHLVLALLEAGHRVRLVEACDVEVDEACRVLARAHAIDPDALPASPEDLCGTLAARGFPRRYVELARVDALVLRSNPLDTGLLALATLLEREGVTVLNPPAGLVATSHKGFVATLPGVPRPPTVVTRTVSTALRFAAELPHGVVVKPARSSGGRLVQRLPGGADAALEAAFRAAARQGDGFVVVQAYLPAARAGEKRILWLDGEAIGAYRRQRAPGEFRHNLKRGGIPEPCALDPADLALVEAVTPHLQRHGTWIAGLDVIDGRLIEVNTLNPGGFHLVQRFARRNLRSRLARTLARRVLPARPPLPTVM